MSLIGRCPGVEVNGVRRMRTFHYFWCETCQNAVRIAFTNPIGTSCPYCSNVLRYELDISRPRFVTNVANLEPSPAATQLLNNLALMLDRGTQLETENEDWIYHSCCIVPWLQLHNTCPVCRYELQGIANNDLQDEHNGNDFCFEEVTNTLNLFWSHLTSYRPFRAFLDWVHRNLDFQENHTSENNDKSLTL